MFLMPLAILKGVSAGLLAYINYEDRDLESDINNIIVKISELDIKSHQYDLGETYTNS